MQGIKAYIFDLDGTMLDTYEHIVQAFEKTLGDENIANDRESIAAVIGMTLNQCYEALAPGHHDHNYLAGKHHENQQTDEMYQLISMYEGLESLLSTLQKEGKGIAIVTNRSRKSVDLIFEHLGIADDVEIVITKDEISKPKPHPEGILEAIRRLGLEPAEAAMVGDTAIDVETGANASVGATIVMTHGFGSVESIKASNPTYILDSFSQFDALVTS